MNTRLSPHDATGGLEKEAARHRPGFRVERVFAFVALLTKQPRTLAQIVEELELSHEDFARHYLRVARGEGLVYVFDWTGPRGATPVYAWQPSVCELPDVPRRASKAARDGDSTAPRALTQPNRGKAPQSCSTERPASVSIERDVNHALRD